MAFLIYDLYEALPEHEQQQLREKYNTGGAITKEVLAEFMPKHPEFFNAAGGHLVFAPDGETPRFKRKVHNAISRDK